MSKGRYVKEKKSSKKWIVLLLLSAVLVGLVVFALSGKTGDDAQIPTETQNASETPADTAAPETGLPGEITAEAENPETAVPTAGESQVPVTTDAAAEPGATKPAATKPSATEPAVPVQTEKPEVSTEAPEPVVGTEPPPVQIIQRAEAEYEKWLAATMVVCVSMEYPDFQLNGIYAASATKLENAMDSEGTYIIFTSGGRQLAFHSAPLAAERTAAGTKDISSETLGFASYDPVNPASVDVTSMEEIAVEDISELISQSMLVSIYEH